MRLAPAIRPRRALNAVPLINIVFLMLIFFLLAGTLATRDALGIRPPETAAFEDRALPDGAVFINAEGSLSMDGNETSLEALAAALAGRGAHGEPVKIFADRGLDAKRLIETVAALRQAAPGGIVLITERRRGP